MNNLLPTQDAADDSDCIIKPGGERPFVIPWCASCGDTVDTFTWDFITSPWRAGLQATCHGKTEGTWVTPEDLLARKRDGVPIVMFKKKAFNRVRGGTGG